MFRRTHRPYSPWTVVRADNKRLARIEIIRHLLTRTEYEDKSRSVGPVDPSIVFTYDDVHLENGKIAE